MEIVVWYPAVRPAAGVVVREDPPDRSAAPYPLLLVGREMAAEALKVAQLASHGFVVAGVGAWNKDQVWGLELIDYPQDHLFVLNHVAGGNCRGLRAWRTPTARAPSVTLMTATRHWR